MASGRRAYKLGEAYNWLLQVASALAHLHTRKPPIVHRDVKPENIFLKREPGSSQLECLLADLGLHVELSYDRPVMLRGRSATLNQSSTASGDAVPPPSSQRGGDPRVAGGPRASLQDVALSTVSIGRQSPFFRVSAGSSAAPSRGASFINRTAGAKEGGSTFGRSARRLLVGNAVDRSQQPGELYRQGVAGSVQSAPGIMGEQECVAEQLRARLLDLQRRAPSLSSDDVEAPVTSAVASVVVSSTAAAAGAEHLAAGAAAHRSMGADVGAGHAAPDGGVGVGVGAKPARRVTPKQPSRFSIETASACAGEADDAKAARAAAEAGQQAGTAGPPMGHSPFTASAAMNAGAEAAGPVRAGGLMETGGDKEECTVVERGAGDTGAAERGAGGGGGGGGRTERPSPGTLGDESLSGMLMKEPGLVERVSAADPSPGLRRVESLLEQLGMTELKPLKRHEMEWVYGLTGKAGSFMYMAPEVFRRLPYNEKSDVFSFAVLAYEVLAGEQLVISIFNTGRAAKLGVHDPVGYAALVASGHRPPRLRCVPDDAWALICACWHEDPVQRPSMQTVETELRSIVDKMASASATTPKKLGRDDTEEPLAPARPGCSPCVIS